MESLTRDREVPDAIAAYQQGEVKTRIVAASPDPIEKERASEPGWIKKPVVNEDEQDRVTNAPPTTSSEPKKKEESNEDALKKSSIASRVRIHSYRNELLNNLDTNPFKSINP